MAKFQNDARAAATPATFAEIKMAVDRIGKTARKMSGGYMARNMLLLAVEEALTEGLRAIDLAPSQLEKFESVMLSTLVALDAKD